MSKQWVRTLIAVVLLMRCASGLAQASPAEQGLDADDFCAARQRDSAERMRRARGAL